MLSVNQLVGFGAGGGLSSIVQQASATSQATTITAPVGIQIGDLIVLCDWSTANSGTVASVLPTGFTQIANLVSGSRMIASYKLADGTEGGASITGMAAGTNGSVAKVIYVFRGNIQAILLTLADVDSEAPSAGLGNPAAQTVTASGGTPPLVILGFYGAGTLVDPRTFTVGGSSAKDGELQSLNTAGFIDADAWIAYKIYNTAPADAVIDMDDEGNQNFLASCYIQMA